MKVSTDGMARMLDNALFDRRLTTLQKLVMVKGVSDLLRGRALRVYDDMPTHMATMPLELADAVDGLLQLGLLLDASRPGGPQRLRMKDAAEWRAERIERAVAA